MVVYSICPICNSRAIQHALTVKDFTVSQQNFDIWECKTCSARFTQNAPDQTEIGPYYKSDTYVSHTDTKKGLINNLYHLVRKKTLAGKRKLIAKETNKKQGEILDIGCGTGAFLNEMKSNNWNVTGLEPDDFARTKAKDLYNIYPLQSDELYNLPFEQYDAITMWHVLEHVHELKEYIEQIELLLKPGGKLFIAVPNYLSYDAQVYQQFWAAYDVPRHLYHFTPRSLKNLLVVTDTLTLKAIKPMWFDSFYVCMLSEQYKGGNIFKAFFNGLKSNIKAMDDKGKCSSIIYVIEKTK
jgi:2-polyprenyl-3-methyl-5-hydroxy-6-metoxy-1,4-benzoquinol methylase